MGKSDLCGTAVRVLVAALLVGCGLPRTGEDNSLVYAYLESGCGVQRVDERGRRSVPGTEEAETFAWCRDGESFLITRGGVLESVGAAGRRSLLIDGYLSLRFPDMSTGDGSIVVAATETSTTEGPWRVLHLQSNGGAPEDLGTGYDPCFLGSGGAVLFEDYDHEGSSIYLLNLESRVRRRLAAGHTPSSASDGQSIFYTAAGQLWELRLDEPSAAPKPITPAGGYDRFASESRHGELLLFFRQAQDANQLIEHELRTGEERVLVEGQVQLPIYRPGD